VRAEAWFEEAIARGQALGVLPEAALAHRDYAHMEIERDGDRSRARALIDKARRMFAELGMAGPAVAATRIPGALGVEETTRAVAPVSQMVQEFGELRARARTDAEIAEELLISPETVASYASLGGESAERTVPPAASVGTDPSREGPAGERSRRGREPVRVILFTDVVGSTALLEAVGDAQGKRLIAEHDDVVGSMLARFGGTKVKHTGDGVVAWFRSVTAAIECAAGIQRELAERNASRGGRSITVRVGISAGEPLVEGGDVFGAAVHEASRICARARAGAILVADVVRYLAHGKEIVFIDRGRALLKGQLRRVRLFEVSWQTAVAGQPQRGKEE
jgi:class 3 adenylate cyclase